MMSWMLADDGANTSRRNALPYRIAKEISPVFTAFAHATSVRCVEYIFVASVAQWIEHFSPKEGVMRFDSYLGHCGFVRKRCHAV